MNEKGTKIEIEEESEQYKNTEEQVLVQTDGEIKEEKESTFQNYREQLQRLQAEFSNYKKRIEQQRLDWQEFIARDILSQLLPVIDDFGHLFHHEDGQTNEVCYEGVKLIYDKFLSTLEKLGLTIIETENCVFDPQYHEAILVEKTDKVEQDKILQVLQKGYAYKGKLLRPAKVKVAEFVESDEN